MKGARIQYSADELAFIKALAALPREIILAEVTAMFGRVDLKVEHIKSLCTRHGWATRARWTPAEDADLRARFPTTNTAVLARELGRAASATYHRAYTLGLQKDPAYLRTAGRIQPGERRGTGTEFRKGQAPANKGLKRGKGWAPGRMRETQFGQRPVWNHQPIGATRIDSEGYEWTKVQDLPKVRTDVNWRPTHTLNWEAVHGPVPDGHALKCLDGNRLNTATENWALVPRGVLARLNGGPHRKRVAFDVAPQEIKPTVMALARLEHAATQRRRNTR